MRAALLALLLAAAPTPPSPTRWVTDEAGLLSAGARNSLDQELAAYEQRTGHQVIVWIGKSTGGEPIESFAERAFRTWGIGRKGHDDGLVLFILTGDRTARIEVGYGLEDRVPDAVANRVLQERVLPALREGRADAGVADGVHALLAAIDGTAPPQAQAPPGLGTTSLIQLIFLAIGALVLLVLVIRHPVLAFWLLRSMGRGGPGMGGSGGRGGFGGGGGRSGGGGATGRW